MEYDRVQQFAAAYQMQDTFARLQQQTLDQFLLLQSYVIYDFDQDKVTPETAKTAARDVLKTIADLRSMDEVGEGLRQSYEKALTKDSKK